MIWNLPGAWGRKYKPLAIASLQIQKLKMELHKFESQKIISSQKFSQNNILYCNVSSNNLLILPFPLSMLHSTAKCEVFKKTSSNHLFGKLFRYFEASNWLLCWVNPHQKPPKLKKKFTKPQRQKYELTSFLKIPSSLVRYICRAAFFPWQRMSALCIFR